MSQTWVNPEILIRVTDFQRYLGVPCANRYYFVDATAQGGYSTTDIRDFFLSDFVVDLLPVQNVNLTHEAVKVEILRLSGVDTIAYYDLTGYDGAVNQEGEASFVALQVKLPVADNGTRPGRKQLAGLSETQGSNNAWDSATLALVADYADHLQAGLIINALDPMPSVIVRNTDTVDKVTTQRPRNQWVWNIVVDAVPLDVKRPQSSRKP